MATQVTAQAGGGPAYRAAGSSAVIDSARIPKYAKAVLSALAFRGAAYQPLASLSTAEWEDALSFCDRAQLTLMLGHLAGPVLPGWVAARIDENSRNNSLRFQKLKTDLLEIAGEFEARSIDYIVLKGLSHSPDFTPDPLLRAQGDCDIWCRPEAIGSARESLASLGYVPLCESSGRHLPPMARPAEWKWDGDYFSPAIPVRVDAHYQLWDEDMQSICAPGEEAFWGRRSYLTVDGHDLPVLCTADTLAFAALHLFMHLLAGDVRLQRAWEIGNFLHSRTRDDALWVCWRGVHPEPLCRIQVIVFLLVSRWFACDLPDPIKVEAELLPEDVHLWIESYGESPVEGLFRADKKELWLHLLLAATTREKIAVFFRRVFPVRVPASVKAGKAPDGMRPQRSERLLFIRSRLRYHLRALVPTLAGGVAWWWKRKQLDGNYIRFLTASVFLDFGMFVFLVLYNLYLLDLGLHEDVVGRVAGGMTAGTFLGAAPAAWLARRIGIRNTLLTAVLGLAATSVFRALVVGQLSLVSTAVLTGAFFACWAVSYSPAIAGLSNERNRPLAFSIVSSVGMILGILGGLAGGRLPGLLTYLSVSSTALGAKRMSLLIGAGVIALAALPLVPLRFPAESKVERNMYPRGKFIAGFLVSLSVWSFATGAFNPFFNTYFSERAHFGVVRIGNVFSCAQLCEAAAVLLAPAVLRRCGQVAGIAAIQLATALTLALLAPGLSGLAAAVVYVSYMSFQFMTAPTLYSMLMSRVAPAERGGASALNFLVTSLTGAGAAVLGGVMISRFGYSPVLLSSAAMAGVAALLFWTLLRRTGAP